MSWEQASFALSGDDSQRNRISNLKTVLPDLTCIKQRSGKKPIFLFIGSKEVVKYSSRSKRPPRQTTQYKATVKAEKTLFQDERSKIPMFLRLFDCYRMDITSVTEEENRTLNSSTAPIVAIFDTDGSLVDFFQGYQVNSGSVLRAMTKVMQPKGINLRQMYCDIYAEQKEVYKAEVDLYNEHKDYREVKARFDKLRKKTQPAKDRLARAQEELEECKAASQKAKANCEEIFNKYEKMLSDVQDS